MSLVEIVIICLSLFAEQRTRAQKFVARLNEELMLTWKLAIEVGGTRKQVSEFKLHQIEWLLQNGYRPITANWSGKWEKK